MSAPVSGSLNIQFLPLVCHYWTLTYDIILFLFPQILSELGPALLGSAYKAVLCLVPLASLEPINIDLSFCFKLWDWFCKTASAQLLLTRCLSERISVLKARTWKRPSLWDHNYLEAPQNHPCFFQKLVKTSFLETEHHPLLCPKTSFTKCVT